MTLAMLRSRGALRSLAAKPVWLVGSLLLLAGVTVAIFRATKGAVNWLYAYPLVGTIAPAITQRSLEGLFLMLMAAVLFSVLIASIGTIYGAADLEFLLAQPGSSARVFTMKVAELFVNTAGLPLVLTLPALAGVGSALHAPASYYLVSSLAAAALYSLPVTLGSLIALLLVRFSPAGRVKEVASALSITLAAAAVMGLRALRPEQLLKLDLEDSAAFEAFLAAFARLEVGWLPPAWATNASWGAMQGALHPSLALLLALGVGGLFLTGALARVAFALGWVRSLEALPTARRRARGGSSWFDRLLASTLGITGVLLAKDVRVFTRDVQQWSQLIVLGALGGVYFVSLAAVPVPTQQFRDVMGALNIAFVSFTVAGVALRIAHPLVSYEGTTYWLLQVQPVRARHVVMAKFLFALPLMLALSLGLGVASSRLLDLSPVLAFGAPLAAASSAFGLTGLSVGLGASHPRFNFTNPNELAMTPAALSYMGLALLYSAAVTLLLARPAWAALTVKGAGAVSYWASAEGLFLLALLLLLTVAATVLPLWRGVSALALYES